MAIDTHELSIDLAREFDLKSDEVIIIQDLSRIDNLIRETKEIEFLKNEHGVYPNGIFDEETDRVYIFSSALELTNSTNGMDVYDVISRLKSKKIVYANYVISKLVVALNWEVLDGNEK